MPLSDATVRSAYPREKDYNIIDSGGLYLLVNRTGHTASYRENSPE